MAKAQEFRERYTVSAPSAEIAVFATEAPTRHRPVAVLLHGTGYLAQVWNGVLPGLAASHTVVALDRRGHGVSSKPHGDYEFSDFADDLVAVLDHLDIRGALGIGHSAGATDVLLAAAHRPDAFSRLFVVEPTVMPPSDDCALELPLGELPSIALEKVRGRRNSFADKGEALARLGRAPAFAGWHGSLVGTFIEHGLEQDGEVFRLRCAPATEAAMLAPIFRVMEQSYRRSAAFASLADLAMPIRIGSCEHSGPLYPPMVAAAMKLIPHATEHTFATGHCVAQQDPDAFVAAVLEFGE